MAIIEDGDQPHFQLGFVESTNPGDAPLTIEHFPTKIGGKPLWLNPRTPLDPAKLTCGACNAPMILLMQIYTAEDFPEEAYHRYLYLFVCRKGACHRGDRRLCARVFRAQLPLDNDFYETDPDTEETTIKPAYSSTAATTCAVCGAAASKRCAACQNTWYCSRDHQYAHWTHAGHKEQCSRTSSDSTDVTSRLVRAKLLFPELEVVSEPELSESERIAAAAAAEGSATHNALVPLLRAPAVPEEYEDSETGVDRAFLKFQHRIDMYPKQVLRYLRVDPELEPEPLFVAAEDKPDMNAVPPCPRCGAQRELECQVLSTVLAYLPLDVTDENSFDFGTYFVLTCPENCELKGEYAEEVVLRQDFSSDGMSSLAQRAEKAKEVLKEEEVEAGKDAE
ncbi:Programmed cell death protein 2 [Allomyces arbusculus]|nr:Programmed cell death protein 2 [Allomyces arbusculus]